VAIELATFYKLARNGVLGNRNAGNSQEHRTGVAYACDNNGYNANRQIDFFGEDAFTRMDGAGGQNRTGYARLFRAALYQ
jgi:hypothetical protein